MRQANGGNAQRPFRLPAATVGAAAPEVDAHVVEGSASPYVRPASPADAERVAAAVAALRKEGVAPAVADKMGTLVREGADVVIASRYRPGSYVRGVRFHRKLLSLAARTLFQTLFPIRGVRDYTSGYRAYRAGVLRDAFERYGDDLVDQKGFQCVVDLLLKLRRRGLIFREVPLILRYDFKRGASKMNVGRTVAQSIAVIVKHRLGA